jgi:hypothetical protein
MGTRNLTVVAIDGQYKVAQYGQWDGYPDGQGKTVWEFLRTMDRPLFESKVRAASYATVEELQANWTEAGADPDSEWVTRDIAERLEELYPQFSRNTAAEVLALIQNAPEGIKLQDDLIFARDSLFCEWAYVIDLDKNTFEVFKGFNKEPLDVTERFYSLQEEGMEYYPIRKAATFDLNNLPDYYAFLNTFVESATEVTGMEPALPQDEPLTGMEPALSVSGLRDNKGYPVESDEERQVYEELDTIMSGIPSWAGASAFLSVQFPALSGEKIETYLTKYLKIGADKRKA